MTLPHQHRGYSFDIYRVDHLQRRLYAAEVPQNLTAKAFDILFILISRPGEVVTKEEILEIVWPDTAVEENNLTQQISAVRKALGEKAGENRFIATIPGRGYCFVAPVREILPVSELIVQESTRSSITIDISDDASSPALWSGRDPATMRGAVLAFSFILVICLGFVYSSVRGLAGFQRTPTLAILTFKSVNGGDEFVGVGIGETLRARLGSVEDVALRPFTPDVDPATIGPLVAGRHLNADLVLTGSVQRDRERVRVSVEMLDVVNRRVVWGKTFDEKVENLFDLQDAIAVEVLKALHSSRSAADQQGFAFDRHSIAAHKDHAFRPGSI